jgi:hypothetical protein
LIIIAEIQLIEELTLNFMQIVAQKGLESKNKCVPLHSQTVSAGKFIERLQQKKIKKK